MKDGILLPGQEFVSRLVQIAPEMELVMDGEVLQSFKPVESLWGYTYHSHMIPPYKPSEILILGYGQGQVADLMRKVWGTLKITGVDVQPFPVKYVENKLVVSDACEFVKECADSLIKTRFDYVLVDLFVGGEVPDLVFEPEFANRLRKITKTLLCLNTNAGDFDRLKPYHEHRFKFHRHVQVFGNIVSFWGRN